MESLRLLGAVEEGLTDGEAGREGAEKRERPGVREEEGR